MRKKNQNINEIIVFFSNNQKKCIFYSNNLLLIKYLFTKQPIAYARLHATDQTNKLSTFFLKVGLQTYLK